MTNLTPMGSSNGHRRVSFEDLRGLRAEGYVRDSTLDQRDGAGPDIQRHNIERFAESPGLVMGTRWYTEFVSGRSVAKREQFQQFLKDARADTYDVLLVDHTSRFGRNQAECIRFKEELQALGKTVVFVAQGIISGSDRDFISERINETLDEQYSRNLSRYVRAGKAEKASAGHALGNAPLGFRHERTASGRGARAVPSEVSMPTLLALLRGYSGRQHSFRTLSQELNAQGHRTTRGNSFTESSISAVLNNPFYDGRFRYHVGRDDEELKQGVHEVPEEVRALWNRCQEVRWERGWEGQPSPRLREHRVYPLTGALICNNCGRPFHGLALRRANGHLSRRMTHSRHRCEVTPRSVAADAVEQEFSDRVLSCIGLDDGWREAVLRAMTSESPRPDHTLELRRVEAAMANLKKQHVWGAVTDQEFKADYQELERQRRTLDVPPEASSITPDLERAAKLLLDLPALWSHPGVSMEQRRDLTREVFEEIRLDRCDLVAVKPRPQYAPLFAYSVWKQNAIGGASSSWAQRRIPRSRNFNPHPCPLPPRARGRAPHPLPKPAPIGHPI